MTGSNRAPDKIAIATRLMSEFATRTGVSEIARNRRRYLWTDAFAVCNFLELFERTGDQKYRHYAAALIDQVHSTLGRYRDDDVRRGWISGLDDETARRHPTAGGLRIGKPLKERGVNEPIDERLEWDRDGQYFHYLTKWMHALCQAAFVIGDASGWAVELGAAAFQGSARRSTSGEVMGVYWKMSTDLSRPLVSASGLHDALDGFITFREAQRVAAGSPGKARAADLNAAIESLSVLCRQRDWTTDDPLGLGGLLFDACRLCQFIGSEERPGDARLLEEVMEACRHGLMAFLAGRQLHRPFSYRLAFRELGLAIGLRALPMIARSVSHQTIDMLRRHESLSQEIIDAWLPYAQDRSENWRAHEDINDVMLATALIPDMFLSIGERVHLTQP
jgi:hypothetical protein